MIADYAEIIRLSPDPGAYWWRTFAYSCKGELEKAIADYTSAIRLKPKDADEYYSSRAQVYEKRATSGGPLAISRKPSR